MIPSTTAFSTSMIVRLHATAVVVCLVFSQHPIATADEVRHLDKMSTVDELCGYATAIPPAADRSVVDYVRLRVHRTHRVYAVDVTAHMIGGLTYDRSTQMLTLVHRSGYAIFDGTQSIRLRGDPLVAFGLDEKLGEAAMVDWAAGASAIRLYFVPDAFHDPFAPFCVEEKSRTQLRGVLVAAHLVRANRAGDMPKPAVSHPIVEHVSEEGSGLIKLLGLGIEGPSGPSLHRIWVGAAKVLEGTLGPEDLRRQRQSVETLMNMCHIAGLVNGGPRSGSLVVVMEYTGAGGISIQVPVEVTGDTQLGTCARRILAHMEPRTGNADVLVKFVLYFEPSRGDPDAQWRR